MYSQFYNPLNAYRVDKPKISLTNCIYIFKLPQKNGSNVIKADCFMYLQSTRII